MEKTKETPILSVIIPTYNRARFLPEALASLEAQKAERMEVLVVDDGSEDDTEAVVRNLSEMYPGLNIRYIWKEHSGISATRNKGISEARAEWIGFLDSDDRWHPEKTRMEFAYVAAHPDCRIVFACYENFLDSGQAISENQQRLLNETDDRYLPSALIHRSLFEQCGLFCEELEAGEDTEWVTRNRLLGTDIDRKLEDVLYYRRVHDGNITLECHVGGRMLYVKRLAVAARIAKQIRRKRDENISSDSSI